MLRLLTILQLWLNLPVKSAFFQTFLMTQFLEAERILMEEKIEEEVKSCMKDLVDNVEKAVQSSKKRPSFRKHPISEPTWVVNKHKKSDESGLEHIDNKGKLLPAKKIVSKKDCY